MTTRINVEVTETDISKAIVSDSYKCVVAQAIARTIPDSTRIEVDVQTIRFTRMETGKRYVYLTPYTVQGYVVAFDAGDVIEPFRFQLRNPLTVKRRLIQNAEPEVKPNEECDKPKEAVETDHLDSPVMAYAVAKRVSTDGDIKAPPRTFKRKSRAYGMRVLRYNQSKAD